MRCPACHAENAAGAARCVACGAPLDPSPGPAVASPPAEARPSGKSKRRVPPTEVEAAAAERWEWTSRASLRAYRMSLLALVPGVGLLLGPAAVLLGVLAARASEGDANARWLARVAVVFGGLVTLTQWAGVLLMLHGWRS